MVPSALLCCEDLNYNVGRVNQLSPSTLTPKTRFEKSLKILAHLVFAGTLRAVLLEITDLLLSSVSII